MKKILLLSDTHSYIDNGILKYVNQTDEVWHAGDIGNIDVLEKLEEKVQVRSVYGNIDNHLVRSATKEINTFICEKIKVCIIHIGGKPPYYNKKTNILIKKEKPKILVCGHSHILKVQYDKKLNILHLNPGAAGKYGFHTIRTMLRFELDKGEIKNLEIIELATKT